MAGRNLETQTEARKTHGQMLIRHLSQLIIEETESLLEKWKHPDPYRAPTAPGGSKYERNLPVPSTERESFSILSCEDVKQLLGTKHPADTPRSAATHASVS